MKETNNRKKDRGECRMVLGNAMKEKNVKSGRNTGGGENGVVKGKMQKREVGKMKVAEQEYVK